METKSIDSTNASSIMSEENKSKDMEVILRKNVKSKALTDDAYTYMSLLINEDQPKNAKELDNLIRDFLTDGMAYTEEESAKLCGILIKHFME